MTRVIQNYIAGAWSDPDAGERSQVFNPARRHEVVCESPASRSADAERAVNAAADAFPGWARLPAPKRAALLQDFLGRLRTREEEFAQIITRENGKTLHEARSEFVAAVKETEFQIGQGLRLAGRVVPSALPGVTCLLARRPLGVATLITPWNFPLNVACRKLVPALIAGNCIVLKPSDLTPATAALLFACLHEAGLPPGAANLLIGRGSVVGDTLVTHPMVRAVSFTGSTEVGVGIAAKLAGRATKVQLEMGGKNPLLVMADANLDQALDAAVTGGFSCAGQWCTSTSRVIIEAPIYDAFVQRLTERVRAIAVGDGTDAATVMGPVCGEQQFKSILAFIESGKRSQARLCAGGHALRDGRLADGWFIAPTLFADATPGMEIAQEEIFGPVLVAMKGADFDEMLRVANGVRYGLASSIYTNNHAYAQRFAAESQVGLCHVNLPTAWKEPQLEFGGVKESGRGAPEAGESGLEFFTRHQALYLQ